MVAVGQDHVDVAKLLLEHGAEVKRVDKDNFTAMRLCRSSKMRQLLQEYEDRSKAAAGKAAASADGKAEAKGDGKRAGPALESKRGCAVSAGSAAAGAAGSGASDSADDAAGGAGARPVRPPLQTSVQARDVIEV